MAKPSRAAPQARFAYEGLDRVIHEKARLGLLTSLAAHPKGLVFADLKPTGNGTESPARHPKAEDRA